MREFSTTYSAYHQRRFLDLVNEGDIRNAVSVLEEMPRGINIEGEAQRIKAILEGYRLIVANFSYPSRDKVEELEEGYGESGRYRKLGDVEKLEEIFDKKDAGEVQSDLKELENYRAVGSLEELRKYRELADVEELEILLSAQKILASI